VAGPGAGKTEVACARVAAALGSGIQASGVLVISFTRAATAEIRERIVRLSGLGQRAIRAVEVRTLDSLAWTLQRHLTEEVLLTGSYADNIARMIELLGDPPEELREYLDSLQLVIIDEAQDIVGLRSELAIRLIRLLPSSAGVTVFADPAQAIYGDWAMEEGLNETDYPPLHDRLVSGEGGDFSNAELTGLHRTSDPVLAGIARDLRAFALVRDMAAGEAYSAMRHQLADRVGANRRRYEEFADLVDAGTSQFFLFRTHGEVVQLSSYLSQAGVRHRLRYPGLPKVVFPWIGRAFSEPVQRRLSRKAFDDLWTDRITGSAFDTGDPEAAWSAIWAVAGEADADRVDVLYLREVLSRRNPPDEVCRPTVGLAGPVLGTIHGSKGREAEEVVLGLTAAREDADHSEEARVLYVGATRARSKLDVAEIGGRHGYLRSRRAWKYTRRPLAPQLEFGLDGDIDPVSPVATALQDDANAIALQDTFAVASEHDPKVEWRSVRALNWQRIVTLDGGRIISSCGKSYDSDLWELTNHFQGAGLKPPDSQRNLYIVDYTTVARDDDSPDINLVTTTFAESGFWVAPVVKGHSLVFIRGGRR